MCHKYLKVDFGPKINFVIGHNGSGKSAILTAITVALGAAAHTTNRGKNLGSLIKEGTE
jgi:chromosome segregation ATPase